MKKILIYMLTLIMLASALPVFSAMAASGVSVYVDGAKVTFDVEPQIINDRTMVPLRAIFEQLGAEVTWDDSTKTAISKKGDITVTISIGEYKLTKSGVDIAIDVPAQIVDSRTLVPVRAISESFDCAVFWENDTRSVRVVTVKLSEPVMTEADNTVVCTLGKDEPVSVSKATYELYAAMSGLTDEDKVIDIIRGYEAMYRYHLTKGVPMKSIFDDAVNSTLYSIVNGGAYGQLIAQYNTTDAALREYFEKNFFITYAQSFEELVQHSDEQIVAYARENYVRVKHILVKDKAKAEEILAKLENGAPFEELAAEHSIDSMNIETGYVFGKGRMVPEFEAKSYELAEGEMSGLVESEYGYHIIKKYPMSDITDEYLVKNFGEDINAELNNLDYQTRVAVVLDTLTVNK